MGKKSKLIPMSEILDMLRADNAARQLIAGGTEFDEGLRATAERILANGTSHDERDVLTAEDGVLVAVKWATNNQYRFVLKPHAEQFVLA